MVAGSVMALLGMAKAVQATMQTEAELQSGIAPHSQVMFLLEGYETSNAKPSFADPHVRSIFHWFVPLYGGILVLWVIFRRSPTLQKVELYNTILLCVTWASMSIGMNVLNKALVTLLGAPTLVAAAQMLVAAIAMSIAWMLEGFSGNTDQLVYWLLVPGVFAGVLMTSMLTMEYISLTLLTVVRNATPMVVLPLEYMLMPSDKRPWVSPGTVAAILIMFIGAVMYGDSLPHVSFLGLFFALLNMIMAVTDRLVQRRLLSVECKDLSLKVCTAVKNGVGLVPTLVVAAATNEFKHANSPESQAVWSDPRTLILLLLSSLVGIGICYSGLACQRAISATSFIVVQNMCKVVVVIAGICVFGDEVSSPLSVAGLVLSIGGSVWFSKIQARAPVSSERQPLVKPQATTK